MGEIVFFAFNPHDSISSSVGSTLMKWIKGSMVQGLVETLTIFSINYSVQFFYCILNNCCNNDVYNLHVGRHFSLLLVAFFSRMIQHFHVGNLVWLWTYFLFSVSPWYSIIFLCLAFSLCILQQSELSIFRHFYGLSSKILPFLWQPIAQHDSFLPLSFFPYILRQYNVGMLFVCVLLPAILLTNSRRFSLKLSFVRVTRG